MRIEIERQVVLPDEEQMLGIPSLEEMDTWARAAFAEAGFDKDCAFTARFVTNDEIQELNSTYRGKDAPTNILSFPYDSPDPEELPPEAEADGADADADADADAEDEGIYLGDLVIAMEVMRREAHEQDKTLTEHCAHLIIHGCLHLLGYDHIEDDEAEEMESLEIKALEHLGFANPYLADEE